MKTSLKDFNWDSGNIPCVIRCKVCLSTMSKLKLQTYLSRLSMQNDHPNLEGYKEKPTPEEIRLSIRNSQPFLKSETKNTFIGLRVMWDLKVF